MPKRNLLSLVLTFCAAISVAQGNPTAQSSSPSPLVLAESANNQSVDAATGQQIVIHLPANPSTGYQWMLQGVSSPLELLKFAYVPGGQKMPGAGGTQTIELVSTAAGTATVVAEYRRPWEKRDVPAGKTFTVKITVK